MSCRPLNTGNTRLKTVSSASAVHCKKNSIKKSSVWTVMAQDVAGVDRFSFLSKYLWYVTTHVGSWKSPPQNQFSWQHPIRTTFCYSFLYLMIFLYMHLYLMWPMQSFLYAGLRVLLTNIDLEYWTFLYSCKEKIKGTMSQILFFSGLFTNTSPGPNRKSLKTI
jgi:hypothetical protein